MIAVPHRNAEALSGPARASKSWFGARFVHNALPDFLGHGPGMIHIIGNSLGVRLALNIAAERGAGEAFHGAPFARLCEVMASKSFLPVCLFSSIYE